MVLPFQTRLTQTKPILPLSNEHGSQVKDQGRRQCCHSKYKKFPYRPTCDASLLSGRASYMDLAVYRREPNFFVKCFLHIHCTFNLNSTLWYQSR